MTDLLKRCQYYTNNGWEINLQLWGDGNNNVYLSKGDVDMWSGGGYNTAEEAIEKVLEYLDRVNKKP